MRFFARTAGLWLGVSLSFVSVTALGQTGAFDTVHDEVDIVKDKAFVTTCGMDWVDGYKFDYCIQNGPGTDPTKVLWYFHGYDGDLRGICESAYYVAMREYWIATTGTAPTCISVSFGSAWFLNDTSKNHYITKPDGMGGTIHVSNSRSFFSSRIMPHMEAKAGATNVVRRFAVGQSMGGYNVGSLITHGQGGFDAAVMGCPALFPMDPWDYTERANYKARHPAANKGDIDWAIDTLFKPDYADSGVGAAAWDNNDPLQHDAYPPLLVWWNTLDHYGFNEGAKQMADKESSRFKWTVGTHCLMSPDIATAIMLFLQ